MRFRRIFGRTAEACVAAGIATDEVIHIDRTLVRADVGWEAIARHHAEAVSTANGEASDAEARDQGGGGDAPGGSGTARVVCTRDPDATLATNHWARRSGPACKQHTTVDGERGD